MCTKACWLLKLNSFSVGEHQLWLYAVSYVLMVWTVQVSSVQFSSVQFSSVQNTTHTHLMSSLWKKFMPIGSECLFNTQRQVSQVVNSYTVLTASASRTYTGGSRQPAVYCSQSWHCGSDCSTSLSRGSLHRGVCLLWGNMPEYVISVHQKTNLCLC